MAIFLSTIIKGFSPTLSMLGVSSLSIIAQILEFSRKFARAYKIL